MQLSKLQTNPILKFFIYVGFGILILSMASFYGFNQSSERQEQINRSWGRIDSNQRMQITEAQKEELLTDQQVRLARGMALQRKLQLLGPQIGQFLQQQGQLAGLVDDKEAVRRAADQLLLLREADRIGLVVSDQEIDNFVKQNYASYEDLEQVLNAEGVNYAQFRERLRRQQRAARAERLIADQATASLYELWQEYLLINEKLKLEIATYPVESYTKDVAVTPDEMQKYLSEHEEDYRVPEKRRYQFVKVARADIQAEINPTDDELKLYWEQNQGLFGRRKGVRLEDVFAPVTSDQPTTMAMRLVTMVADRATTTGQWPDLAIEIERQNPGSRLYYRNLGLVENNETTRADMGEEYLKRAAEMAVDQVSTPTLSPRGVHLIHKLESQEAEQKTFEQAKEEVLSKYREEKGKEAFRQRAEKMRENLQKSATVRDFAQAEGLTDSLTTETLTSAAFIPEVGNFSDHATYVRSLKLNQISQLIPIPAADPQSYVVLQVVEIKPSHIPALADVEEEIRTKLAKQKAVDLAKGAAEEALRQMREQNVDFTAATTARPGENKTTEFFTRMQGPPGFSLIGFQKESVRAAEGSVGATPYGSDPEAPEGYAVWKVIDTQPPSREEFRKERRNFEQDYLALQQLTVVEEWLADQRRQANFKITADLETQTGE